MAWYTITLQLNNRWSICIGKCWAVFLCYSDDPTGLERWIRSLQTTWKSYIQCVAKEKPTHTKHWKKISSIARRKTKDNNNVYLNEMVILLFSTYIYISWKVVVVLRIRTCSITFSFSMNKVRIYMHFFLSLNHYVYEMIMMKLRICCKNDPVERK